MFYKKGIDITNAKQMFEFLKGHYMYDTMNSWNGLKSIANNVKCYNLGLEGDYWTVVSLLHDEFDRSGIQEEIKYMIEDWEAEHEGYQVGFNGRSCGYLVLYNKKNSGHVLPSILLDSDYEEFKDYCKEYYGGLKYFKDVLREYTKLVQDFDKLCDSLRSLVNEYSKINLNHFYLESAVNEFNVDFEEDLIKCKMDSLEVKNEDGELTVDLTPIASLLALKMAFERILNSTGLDYLIVDNLVTIN